MSSNPIHASYRRPFMVAVAWLAAVVLLAALWLGRGDPATADGAATSASTDGGAVTILLELADAAVKEHRVLAPAGSNAYEFYFSVLALDRANPVALQGQQALFPAAAAELEQAINQGQLDEAQRELALLREYDADNFKVSLLAGKLDAQRQLVIRADEARAAQIQARARAAGAQSAVR